MKFLYTDIDYVLSLASEMGKKQTRWGWISPFNAKAVAVYNHILRETGAVPVISSDWKLGHSLEDLQGIFTEFAGIEVAPIDVTESLWGVRFRSLQELEECRATEILMHVEKHKPEAWVAIDDLDISKFMLPWESEKHFVHLPRMNEGIKQSGKADKVIKLLNATTITPNNKHTNI